ncbi:MAG: anti-sigma factor [Nitrospirae bacterium]|nr:anti-sigma factor [Nitrospirota bacterium]
MMTCDGIQSLIHGYLDGELDAVTNIEIDRHLQTCPTCAPVYTRCRTLQTALRNGSLSWPPPVELVGRVRSALDAAHPGRKLRSVFRRPGLQLVGALAMVSLIAWGLLSLRHGTTPEDLIIREVVSSHVRSLMADHLTDVPSTDLHTVKPWFHGRLDFSPPVKSGGSDFSLIGGRLDYLGGRPVAALVYRHQQHPVNLFIWPLPDRSDTEIQSRSLQGYNLLWWTQSGMSYWVVSDLNAQDLQEFARSYR